MYALNKSQIIGYLTEDPQIRQTPSGQFVGDLNIMTKQNFINASSQVQVSTSYINVVVWRGLAEISQKFLKKGSNIYISGRIQTDDWEDNEGNKRYKTRVVADDIILLSPKTPNAPIPSKSRLNGGLNKSEIIGNITRDPEIRQTPNGDSVASFGVATNFSWKDRSGQGQERTEFHNIVAWGALAQDVSDSLKKGRKVYVSGRLQTRSWETPDGQKKWTTEIIADSVLALGTIDPELSGGDNQTHTEEANSKADEGIGLENPSSVPDINYKPEIKAEDLPF